MARSRKALSSTKYDREFSDIDDTDHMAYASSEIARPILEGLVRKARNSAELLSAVSIASARRERAVLRPILEKLRDTPFRMDAKLEKLLVPIMGPENEDDVRNEIDGENPFRDRREALGRALAVALKGS